MSNTPISETKKTLQDVIDEIGGASEIHGTTNLAAECLTEGAEFIGSRGGFDVYALEYGDWFLSANDGSTHLVIADDLDNGYGSEAAMAVKDILAAE